MKSRVFTMGIFLCALIAYGEAPARAMDGVIYCSVEDFRGRGQPLNFVGTTRGQDRLEKFHGYEGEYIYAKESNLTGKPSRGSRDPLNTQKFHWPQEALVWDQEGGRPVAQKTYLLLPSDFTSIRSSLQFVGYLVEKDITKLMVCFIDRSGG